MVWLSWLKMYTVSSFQLPPFHSWLLLSEFTNVFIKSYFIVCSPSFVRYFFSMLFFLKHKISNVSSTLSCRQSLRISVLDLNFFFRIFGFSSFPSLLSHWQGILELGTKDILYLFILRVHLSNITKP